MGKKKMKNYLSVQMIKARKMSLHNWYKHIGKPEKCENSVDEPGYLVASCTGMEHWDGVEIFNRMNMRIKDASTITEDDIEEFIGDDAYTATRLDEKTTLVSLEPRTGFIQYHTSSCVDPGNYDHEIGTETCKRNLRNSIWPFLGFVLQWARFGLDPKK